MVGVDMPKPNSSMELPMEKAARSPDEEREDAVQRPPSLPPPSPPTSRHLVSEVRDFSKWDEGGVHVMDTPGKDQFGPLI